MAKAGIKPSADDLTGHDYLSAADAATPRAKYTSPIVKKYGEEAKEVGGHGGMDFIMDSRFVYCLQNGLPLDMDVYDLAEWCCLAELGAISMDNGCLPIEVATSPAATGTRWRFSRALCLACRRGCHRGRGQGFHRAAEGQRQGLLGEVRQEEQEEQQEINPIKDACRAALGGAVIMLCPRPSSCGGLA